MIRIRTNKTKLLNYLGFSFLILLVSRSISDAFPQALFYIGSVRFSISAGLGLFLIIIGITYLGILLFRKSLIVDKLGWIFLGWILCLAPWVYLAAANFKVSGLVGVREWIRLFYLAVVYLVVYSITMRLGFRKVINTILLALPVPLIWTYYQFIGGSGKTALLGNRTSGPMVHPNILATFLVIMIALTIWKLVQSKGLKQYLWAGLLVSELVAVVTPISSNGWLMFIVFLFVVALLTEGKRFKTGLAIGTGLFVLLFVIMVFSIGSVQTEFTQLFQIRSYQEISQIENPQNTIEGRILMWGKLLDKWRNRPFSGYGLNTSDFVNPVTGKAPHNDFVRYLVECGIPGLLLFVTFQISAGWRLFKLRGEVAKRHVELRNFFGLCTGLYLGWVVASFGDNVMAQTAFQIYLWALLGTATASAMERKKENDLS